MVAAGPRFPSQARCPCWPQALSASWALRDAVSAAPSRAGVFSETRSGVTPSGFCFDFFKKPRSETGRRKAGRLRTGRGGWMAAACPSLRMRLASATWWTKILPLPMRSVRAAVKGGWCARTEHC